MQHHRHPKQQPLAFFHAVHLFRRIKHGKRCHLQILDVRPVYGVPFSDVFCRHQNIIFKVMAAFLQFHLLRIFVCDAARHMHARDPYMLCLHHVDQTFVDHGGRVHQRSILQRDAKLDSQLHR